MTFEHNLFFFSLSHRALLVRRRSTATWPVQCGCHRQTRPHSTAFCRIQRRYVRDCGIHPLLVSTSESSLPSQIRMPTFSFFFFFTPRYAVKELIRHGADSTIMSRKKKTASDMALANQHTALASLLASGTGRCTILICFAHASARLFCTHPVFRGCPLPAGSDFEDVAVEKPRPRRKAPSVKTAKAGGSVRQAVRKILLPTCSAQLLYPRNVAFNWQFSSPIFIGSPSSFPSPSSKGASDGRQQRLGSPKPCRQLLPLRHSRQCRQSIKPWSRLHTWLSSFPYVAKKCRVP